MNRLRHFFAFFLSAFFFSAFFVINAYCRAIEKRPTITPMMNVRMYLMYVRLVRSIVVMKEIKLFKDADFDGNKKHGYESANTGG